MGVTDSDPERLDVGPGEAGERLDSFLARHDGRFSRNRFKALIKDGQVRVGGRTLVEPNYRVKSGDDIAVTVPEPQDPTPQPEAIPLNVIFEDGDLIVIDKPAGLVVHPAAGNPDRTLVNALIAHCGASLSGIGGVLRPGIVHRLDKDTTGLIVAAKNDAAHASLARQLKDRKVAKTYIALVEGVLKQKEGLIDAPIGRDPRHRKRMAVIEGGRESRTRYTVLREIDRRSLLEVKPETGRTHQIRVHLAAQGHPVIGDPLYGGAGRRRHDRLSEPAREVLSRFNRQALHARSLGFRHPLEPKEIRLESDLPADINELICCLE